MRKFVFFILSVIVLSCAGSDSTEKYITEHYAMEGSSVEIVETGKPFRIDFGDFEYHVRAMLAAELMLTNATFPEDTLTKAQRDSIFDTTINIADSIADTISMDLLRAENFAKLAGRKTMDMAHSGKYRLQNVKYKVNGSLIDDVAILNDSSDRDPVALLSVRLEMLKELKKSISDAESDRLNYDDEL